MYDWGIIGDSNMCHKLSGGVRGRTISSVTVHMYADILYRMKTNTYLILLLVTYAVIIHVYVNISTCVER